MKRFASISPLLVLALMSLGACAQKEAATAVPPASSSQSIDSSDTSLSSLPSSSGTTVDMREAIDKKATTALAALQKKDMATIARLASAKGITFSPYAYIHDDDITFSPEKISDFFSDTKTYLWGSYDGSGMPIELTPAAYYKKFIFDRDFLQQGTRTFDTTVSHGNTMNTIAETYPNAHSVNFHYTPTSEENENAWADMWMVFEKENGDWMLRAIVHDQWTI